MTQRILAVAITITGLVGAALIAAIGIDIIVTG